MSIFQVYGGEGEESDARRGLRKHLATGESGLELGALLSDLGALELELLAVDEVASAGDNDELSIGVFRFLGAHLSRAFLRIWNSIELALHAAHRQIGDLP